MLTELPQILELCVGRLSDIIETIHSVTSEPLASGEERGFRRVFLKGYE